MRVITVGLSAICIILGMNNIFNVKASKDVEQAIKETRPTVEEQVVNNYNTINNYNETHNHYESDNNEEIEDLKNQINELKKESNKDEQVLVSVDSNNVVRPVVNQSTSNRDPWTGPKSYKCNRMAGYPAICGYCGEQGEIHYNIKEWQDTQGTYHLTHIGCGQRYCDKIGVEPRVEEAYKIR